ncbi:MAG TPA: peptide chain release factor N(5)-glutamine methyltransferase, partial [Candidatus Saccharimonadales bacterium]
RRSRAWLLAHPEHELSPAQIAKLEKLLNRRAGHEPLAYIRGKAEFYGREFVLTPAVLQPRPESETMIDLLKALPLFDASADPATKKRAHLCLADIGTGSGALGITALLELPQITVDLIEIDPKALKIAKINVDKFTLSISPIRSDLLAQVTQNYDILLCNLPYVPDDFHINRAASKEPALAIFGGPDGLDLYRRLFQQIQNLSKKPLYILTESLPPQHQELEKLARAAGFHLQQESDFIQVFKPA